MLTYAKRVIQALIDGFVILVCWWLAFWLRFNLDIPGDFTEMPWRTAPMACVSFIVAWTAFQMHRHVWRYTGLAELRQLGLSVMLGALLTAALVMVFRYPNFPRSVLLLHPMLVIVGLGALRASLRSLSERHHGAGQPVLIAGSLSDAADALRTLKGSERWSPFGIVSPHPEEVGRSLQGIPVYGTVPQILALDRTKDAQTILIAAPKGSNVRREVLAATAGSGGRIQLLTLPHADDWLHAGDMAPRKVELEDLLGRAAVQLDSKGLSELFSGHTVLVTGAGGSIGSELCRQIARFGVARLVCVDMSEIAMYRLEQELRQAHPQMTARFYIANVRELDRLQAIMTETRAAVVFHAAAYKHVPLMEDLNEVEAVRTNVAGTLHVARAAGRAGVRRFVMISTDKAVNPTNVMGASKRVAERVVQAVAASFPDTQFVSVRFGNVLGSSGSVVPLFTEQIARGGPVTVTHPDIVRYFMTIPEAAQLVLQAGLIGRSGQIFVLDMGEPVKIVDLARMMIRLSGKSEDEVPIAFTGLRPGEKLYEELLADGETTVPTPHAKLRVAKAGIADPVDPEAVVGWIEAAGPSPNPVELRQWLRSLVPEYRGVDGP